MSASQPQSPGEGIFAGLNVLDFTWAAAGPILTKQLSDNGANVVKIESGSHPDSVRLGAPFKDAKPGINRSGFFADFNSSKRSVAVNMGSPEGRQLVLGMTGWADVVAENFRPGVMDRWGLGYERMRELNPRLIYLSSSLYGDDGPWSGLRRLRRPGGRRGGNPRADRVARPAARAAQGRLHRLHLSPLRYVRAGGRAYLARAHRPGPAHRAVPGGEHGGDPGRAAARVPAHRDRPRPRRERRARPSAARGAPVRRDDAWIAVEVRSDAEWDGLLGVLAGYGDTGPLRKLSAVESLDRTAEVERLAGAITAAADRFELMDRLQAARVPSGVVLSGADLLADRRLRARGHFWALEHAEMGRLDYNGPAYRFERTPSRLTSAAPLLGEHTDEVMRTVLGLDDNEIERLRTEGVLQ